MKNLTLNEKYILADCIIILDQSMNNILREDHEFWLSNPVYKLCSSVSSGLISMAGQILKGNIAPSDFYSKISANLLLSQEEIVKNRSNNIFQKNKANFNDYLTATVYLLDVIGKFSGLQTIGFDIKQARPRLDKNDGELTNLILDCFIEKNLSDQFEKHPLNTKEDEVYSSIIFFKEFTFDFVSNYLSGKANLNQSAKLLQLKDKIIKDLAFFEPRFIKDVKEIEKEISTFEKLINFIAELIKNNPSKPTRNVKELYPL